MQLMNPKKNKYEIAAIYKVNNEELLAPYNSELDRLKGLGIDTNEKLLFHGSSGNNPKTIYTNGFRAELARFGRLGKGLYFARKISYALKYAYTRHGEAYLFLSSVITGRSKVCSVSDIIYGPRNVGGEHDSLTDIDNLDDKRIKQMFAVSRNCQTYPKYLIAVDLIYSMGTNPKNNYNLKVKKNLYGDKKIDEDYDPL
jgi:hypothetical protein